MEGLPMSADTLTINRCTIMQLVKDRHLESETECCLGRFRKDMTTCIFEIIKVRLFGDFAHLNFKDKDGKTGAFCIEHKTEVTYSSETLGVYKFEKEYRKGVPELWCIIAPVVVAA
jgi:hypothetical protein